MNPERWRQIDGVLQSVLERAPEQRRAFLDEACAGDAQLRSEVESFIVAHEQAGGFIETPAIEVDAAVVAGEQSASAAGQTIAHYQIIGSGSV
jgi:hypothetical protein